MTINKDGSPRKAGSGRKRGSVSFKEISLSELNDIFLPSDKVKVSRVWLEKEGLSAAIKKCDQLNNPNEG